MDAKTSRTRTFAELWNREILDTYDQKLRLLIEAIVLHFRLAAAIRIAEMLPSGNIQWCREHCE